MGAEGGSSYLHPPRRQHQHHPPAPPPFLYFHPPPPSFPSILPPPLVPPKTQIKTNKLTQARKWGEEAMTEGADTNDRRMKENRWWTPAGKRERERGSPPPPPTVWGGRRVRAKREGDKNWNKEESEQGNQAALPTRRRLHTEKISLFFFFLFILLRLFLLFVLNNFPHFCQCPRCYLNNRLSSF